VKYSPLKFLETMAPKLPPALRLALGCSFAASVAGGEARLFVAPNGRDDGPGTRGQPFATLERARQAVRELKAAGPLTQPVEVCVYGGTYFLAQPLVFSSEDSGTEQAPIIYSAAEGETPVISGGVSLTGWRPEGNFLVTTVPAVKEGKLYFKSLFVNGRRAVRAREPDGGFYRIRGVLEPEAMGVDRQKNRRIDINRQGFVFGGDDIKPWPDVADAVVVRYAAWETSLNWIKSVDPERRRVLFAEPKGWAPGTQGHRDPRGDRYYVENIREALDEPGEWHLDRATGEVRYLPREGESAGTLEAVAGVLERLVEFRGDPAAGKTVGHIRLQGLTFAHTDWDGANTRKVPVRQAQVPLASAMIFARGAVGCTIEDCELVHGGTHGIWLEEGCRFNRVVRCQIHDLGGGGVYIGGGGDPDSKAFLKNLNERRTNEPRSHRLTATDNTVDNCFIHDLNHVFGGSIGVWLGVASHTRVTRNEICDLDYSGISVGWDWFSRSPPVGQANLIEGNHIHHLGYGELSDLAGIYTLGRQPGTVLRNNVIHDVNDYLYGGWGLYNDAGSSEFLMEKNVVYDTNDESYFQNNDSERNVVRNNILAFPGTGHVRRGLENNCIESPAFDRNIFIGRHGAPFSAKWQNPSTFRSERNVFWDTEHAPEQWIMGGYTWEQWRKRGVDAQSVAADPLFVDAAGRDFRLKPGSPALTLGFEPPDLAAVGLYGDPEWVALPKQKVFRAVHPEARPPDGRPRNRVIVSPFKDDFEATAPGETPDAAMANEYPPEGTVRVAGGAGRGGGRAVVFAEGPGVTVPHMPALVYATDWTGGEASLAFDILPALIEGGAFEFLWRDWYGKDIVPGPSVQILPNGALRAAGRILAQLPPDVWTRLRVSCRLGKDARGTFDLVVETEGRPAQTFAALPCPKGKSFYRANWIGFLCHGVGNATVHMDNVEMSCR
jgi:hypothetical protein